MVGFPGGAREFDALKHLSNDEMKELSKEAATAAVISHGQFLDSSAASEYFFNAYFSALELFRAKNKATQTNTEQIFTDFQSENSAKIR